MSTTRKKEIKKQGHFDPVFVVSRRILIGIETELFI
jgi:hypothetical protein